VNIDECFELGYIIKPHGLKGAVDIYLDTDFPEDYRNLESVYVRVGQKLVPFFIKSMKLKGNKALVHFEDVDTIESSESLKGCTLLLPDSQLPKLEGKEFYFHEVIGFNVRDISEGDLGKVTKYYDQSYQVLLSVDHNGKEILVPVSDDVILGLDRVKKIIEVSLPAGLVDIYTED
jgi:16S rRNA processing protein RimM